MKNTFLLLFLIITLFSGLFLGCKKYEDGPKFTLRTVKHRLTSGTWKLQELIYNGSDSSSRYDTIDFKYNFSTNGSLATTTTYKQSFTYDYQLHKVYGTVSFTKNDEIIMSLDNGLYYNYSQGYYPDIFSYNGGNSPVWKILELSEKAFWLQTTITDSNGQAVPVIMKLYKSK